MPIVTALRLSAISMGAMLLASCSHTIKSYTGPERPVGEIAYIYPHAGASMVGIRYIDDVHVDAQSAKAVIHALPGHKKLTIVHFHTKQISAPGYTFAIEVTWTLYEVPVDLKAGYTYFSWPSGRPVESPREACIVAYPHEEFQRLYGADPNKTAELNDVRAVAVGCGRPIDAPGYIAKYGKP